MAVGIALALASTLPVAARQEGESPKPPAASRILVQVEQWWASPRNLDLDYAFVNRTGTLSGGGEIFTLSEGPRAEPRFRLAWRASDDARTTAGATLWEFDGSASSSTGRHPSMVGALLASPDFAIGRSLVDFARARWRVRGTLVDADLSWTHDIGARALLNAAVGVRLFRFEHETGVIYGSDSSGSELREFINVTTDASGIGPRSEVFLGYRAGRRVVVGGHLGLALPVGRLKGEASDQAFVDGNFDRATVSNRPGTRRAFVQLDGGLSVEVRIASRVAASVSYLYMQWPRVTSTERFVDDVSQNTAFPVERDVVFEGLSVAISCEF